MKRQPTDQSQHIDTTYVTEIATLTLVSTATGGAAQAKQTVWTSNGWIINIHGQPWPMEAYNIHVNQRLLGNCDCQHNTQQYKGIEIIQIPHAYIIA